jgi:YVTN family beta-propeller protein
MVHPGSTRNDHLRIRRCPRLRARVVALTAATLLIAGCSSGTATESPTAIESSPLGISSSSPVARDLPPAEDIDTLGGATLDVPDADWMAVAAGSAWTTLGRGVVQQLDGEDGSPGMEVPVDGPTCTAPDVGFGSLWVPVCEPGSVVRIDPDTGKSQTIDLDGATIQEEGSIAAGEGSVWLVTATPQHALLRIDPKSNKVVGSTPLPDGVVAVRVGLGGLWATDVNRGLLLRLDPETGEVLTETAVGAGPRFFDVGEGAVWVQNNRDGTVSRVDPATDQVTETIAVDLGPIEGGDLTVGGGYVWARVGGSLVTQIDPATNLVVARIGQRQGSGSVAADEDAVWISAHDRNVVYRVPVE